MEERVAMWKASKNVNDDKNEKKRPMPHQLLALYSKQKPKRIRGTVKDDDDEKNYQKCNICFKIFNSKTKLFKHKKSHLPINTI